MKSENPNLPRNLAEEAFSVSLFNREFLLASAVHALILLILSHVALFSWQVYGHGASLPAIDCLKNPSEQLFQLESVLHVTVKTIKQGFFPAWDPYAEGGTPLLGKMMNGTFSPYHLLLYVFPLSWFPILLTLIVILQSYVAFAFTYLYARLIRVGCMGAIIAGTMYTYCVDLFNQHLFATFSVGTYLPLLLLLAEIYSRRRERAALLFLPWAVALPFFAGHFESAFRIELIMGVYILIRLSQRPGTWLERIRSLMPFTLAALIGVALASPQILAGIDYAGKSYNNVWRTLERFGWEFHTINKHLSMDDWPLILVGGVCVFFTWVLLKRFQKLFDEKKGIVPLGLTAFGSALALMVAIASLENVGLTIPMPITPLYFDTHLLRVWLVESASLFLCVWSFTSAPLAEEMKIIGILLLGGILIRLRFPPLSNLIQMLPLFSKMNNAVYLYEYHFTLAIGVGYSFGIAESLSKSPIATRLREALRAVTWLAIGVAGILGAYPLSGIVARLVPTALSPHSQEQRIGGIMGPERVYTPSSQYTVTGWLPYLQGLSDIQVGIAQDSSVTSTASATLESTNSSRQYFHGQVSIPEGKYTAFAKIHMADGKQSVLIGPLIDRIGHPPAWMLVSGLLLVALLVPAGGAWISRSIYGLLIFFFLIPIVPTVVPASEIPFQIPGVRKIQADHSLFRVSSTTGGTFFAADYANLYDLSDIRNGGDNLDVLPDIYFNFLSGMLFNSNDPHHHDLLYKLLGLANVKYLLYPAGTVVSHPALKPFYDGSDVSIYENTHLQARASFFDHFQYFPELTDQSSHWDTTMQALNSLAKNLSETKTDITQTLLLHDLPKRWPESKNPAFSPGMRRVEIMSYTPNRVLLSVDTDIAGFVFLNDTFFPGWYARVNGRLADIFLSWIAFRSVQVPVGHSTVEFFYQPWFLLPSLAICALISVLWLGRRLGLKNRGDLWVMSRETPLVAIVSGRKKNRAAVPQNQDCTPALTMACARYAVRLLEIQIYSGMAFWAFWSAVCYRERLWVNALSWIIIVLFAVWLGRYFLEKTPVNSDPRSGS